MPSIKDITNCIEDFAPRHLQEDYDNAGLQVGDALAEATSALLCVDVTEALIDEAIERGCNLVISHHPLLFHGIKSINPHTETCRIIIKAIKNGITIYSAHTNLDNAFNGVSFDIARRLDATNISVLDPQQGKFLKLVTFVPASHAIIVYEAVSNAGAGKLGNYDKCSFQSNGEGRFRALEGANPYVGELDEIHIEPEIRQEYLVPIAIKDKIINALLDSHPYEEPAFDLIPLANESKYSGSGVIANIAPSPVKEFLEKLKKTFKVGSVRFSDGNCEQIQTIAICGGSGAFLISKAINAGADIFITGDIKYHDFTTFGNDIIIADIGHYESEQFTKDIFYNTIRENFPNFVTYYPEKEINPINYL